MHSVQLLENVSLKKYSTMRLGGTARYVAEITASQDVGEAIAWAAERQLPVLVVGGGSNVVWRDEGFTGLLLVNKIPGFEAFKEDDQNIYLTVGGGEEWDSVVRRTVEDGLTGIEALSMVPGTAGAAPVQNIGAYGQELSDTLVTVEAYDFTTKRLVTIPAAECAFGYRTSRFKTTDHGRFFITAITLHLVHGLPQPPYYQALQDYLNEHNLKNCTPQMIREAVMAVRLVKLPDPRLVANNGSFFSNPIISEELAAQLRAAYPDMPGWDVPGKRVKIPAGWLIEQVGLKGYKDAETGMATWPVHALVLVNEHAKTTADLLKFRQKILDAVQAKFGINLEQEPELLPL